jgi:hypothetical protein
LINGVEGTSEAIAFIASANVPAVDLTAFQADPTFDLVG